MATPRLELEDLLLLDGVDYRVVAVLVGRTDRMSFRCVTVEPDLGGEQRMLLQTEDGLLDAKSLSPQSLEAESATIDGHALTQRWQGVVRTEREVLNQRARFGRGNYRWFSADDGTVAVLIDENDEREALLGVPLEPGRTDLSSTIGLRKGGRG